MEQVIYDGTRYRVQLADGTLQRGRYHTFEQADEARLRLVAARVLRILYPAQYSDFPSRDPNYPRPPAIYPDPQEPRAE